MMKKGFVGDLVVYLLALFLMAIVFLVLYLVISNINTAWQADPGMNTESKSIVSNFKNSFAGIYDKVYLFLVIGYFVIILILAYFLRSYPAFALITFLVLLVFGIIGVHFSNTYYDLAASSSFSSVAADFTIMNYLATKLPHIIILFGTVFIIVLYAKSNQQGGL